MKKLSQEAKFNLKNGFGSLISNRSAIEAGKSMPWWSAVIIGLIGAFLPMIPIMVNILNTNGSSLVNATNYGFDRNASLALISYKNDNYSLLIDEETKQSTLNKDNNVVAAQDALDIASYVNPITKQYDIRTYYIWDYNDKSVSDYYNEIANTLYITGSTTIKGEQDPEGTTYYKPTIVVYHTDGFSINIMKANSTASGGSFAGDYKEVTFSSSNVNRDVFLQLMTVEGIATPATPSESTPEYEAGVKNNYKTFLDQAYLSNKNRTFLYTTTIYYAVYVGLTLFLGLLIFLLTRGKRNFNNYLKWYQCMGIAAWSSFSPGLLSLILGFMIQSYAVMFYILFLGVRIMWMTMRQLSPTYQQA